MVRSPELARCNGVGGTRASIENKRPGDRPAFFYFASVTTQDSIERDHREIGATAYAI